MKKQCKCKKDKQVNFYDWGGEFLNAFNKKNALGTSMEMLGGTSNIIGAGMQNAQIADISGLQSQADSIKNYNVQSNSNESLLDEWSNANLMSNVTYDQVRGVSRGESAMNTLGGVVSGASSGASAGPLGAIIGGTVGLFSGLGGLFGGNVKAKKEQERLNKEIQLANQSKLRNLANRANTLESESDFNLLTNYAAKGGLLRTQSEFSNGINIIGNGGTHESNPNDGIQVGVDPQGIPNLVEEGEVIFNDYVFSNRLKPSTKFKKQNKLNGNTFADLAKKAQKESKERPNDPISKKGLMDSMNRLQATQEEVKMKDNIKNQGNVFATGGSKGSYNNYINQFKKYESSKHLLDTSEIKKRKIDYLLRLEDTFPTLSDAAKTVTSKLSIPSVDMSKYNIKDSDYINETIEGRFPTTEQQSPLSYLRFTPSSAFKNKINLPVLQYKTPEQNQYDRLTGNKFNPSFDFTPKYYKDVGNGKGNGKTEPSPLSYLRYAPALMSGIATIGDMFGGNKPDYSNADIIGRELQNIPTTRVPKVNRFIKYQPLDTNYLQNKLAAQSGATRESLINQSAGNRAQAMNGLLALDYNTQGKMGDLYRQAQEYNQAQRERVETFNRQTDMTNTEFGLRADAMNQQAAQQRLSGRLAEVGYRDKEDQISQASRMSNLNTFMENLSGIGREEFIKNTISSLPSLLYSIDNTGNVSYRKAKGGKLNKRY